MEGPAGALIGVTALGLGALIGYGAYKNVPVFGPGGLLTGTLQTGKLEPVVPPAGSSTSTAGGSGSPPNPFLEWTLGVGSHGWFRYLTPAGIWTWLFNAGPGAKPPYRGVPPGAAGGR